MTQHRNNLRLVAGICLTVTVLAILVLGGVACYQWGRASERGDQEAETTLVSGCRASYRAELIDLPTTKALRAIQRGDDVALEDAVTGAKVEDYQALVELSQRDVPAFLEQCVADGRAG